MRYVYYVTAGNGLDSIRGTVLFSNRAAAQRFCDDMNEKFGKRWFVESASVLKTW